MAGIQSIVANHFEILFRDMLHKELNKLDSRERPFHICIILMPVVMKSNCIVSPVITIDPLCSDDGTAKITSNVFSYGFRIGEGGLGINIEALFMQPVHRSLCHFKGRADVGLKQV